MAKKMTTAYGQNRQKIAAAHSRSATIRAGLGLGSIAGGAFITLTGNPILGAAAMGIGVASMKAGVRSMRADQSNRHKAHAIEHLVNYSRRQKGRSGKQIEANAHDIGVVKGHYRTDHKTGKAHFVKEHRRSIVG
jgi:hypothetical protein